MATEMNWSWVKVNGMTYLWDPNTGGLYDNMNLFPSGFLYRDGAKDFKKQPLPLVSTMNDPQIKEYMKNPTKQTNKSGMDWAAYWQKRRAKEAAEGKPQGWQKEKGKKEKGVAALTAKMTTIHL
jgi:hypothetical protein